MLSVLYAIARLSVWPSVCYTDGWVRQKRLKLKLGSWNFHTQIQTPLYYTNI